MLASDMTVNALSVGMIVLGVVLFVVGWVFQFAGHCWEGRKPAFVDDIVGLLVGPMFVVGEWMMALGLLGSLRRAIDRQAGPVR